MLIRPDHRVRFQSTLPRGERLTQIWHKSNDRRFQSTLPRGERPTSPRDSLSQSIPFQSTLPRGERPPRLLTFSKKFRVNPRSRGGSDTERHEDLATKRAFQSTLPRGERLREALDSVYPEIRFQSTLPRGERRWSRWRLRRRLRFNPRSRGGSDWTEGRRQSSRRRFNPRSRGGSDLGGAEPPHAEPEFQSTLPRGERRKKSPRKQRPDRFNPRSRGGSDRSVERCYRCSAHSFNPRSRGGSDVGLVAIENIHGSFNPRSRGGSDPRTRRMCRWRSVSIHAPAGGATRERCVVHQWRSVSIHAPAGGATENCIPSLNVRASFNPRSRGGSDIADYVVKRKDLVFQSTLPRGERRKDSSRVKRFRHRFNPRSRGGSD